MPRVRDVQVMVALTVGFVAFSLPLIFHDTRHIHGILRPASVDTETPPPPPPYHAYHDEDANTPEARFRRAVSEGDIQGATALLAEDGGHKLIETAHYNGNTPLFEAARSGHIEMVRWLISKGVEVDKVNEWGDAPVQEAATMGHFEIVWLLADHGANLTRTHDNLHSGLLLSAVRHRSVDALKELKKRGVDMSTRHWNGNTVLHEAARTGELEMITWLVDSGMDINAHNDGEETALVEAAQMGQFEVVTLLLDRHADIGATGSHAQSMLAVAAVRHGHMETLQLLHSRGVQFDTADKTGELPLLEAVKGTHAPLAIVDWLLDTVGVNASAVSRDGESAMASAAHHGHWEVVWKLHSKGVPLDAPSTSGSSPLMSAVYFENEAEVVRLLAAGQDADHATGRGDTSLTIACSKGNLALVRLLVEHGARPTPRGRRKDTPLIRAARFRRLEVTKLLLDELHVPVDEVNKHGDTALLEAARVGHTDLIIELLDAKAAIEHRNERGETPFLAAAEGSRLLAMKLLHSRGADAHAQTKSSDGATEAARWGRKSAAIGDWLREIGVKPRRDEHDAHGGDDAEDHDREHPLPSDD